MINSVRLYVANFLVLFLLSACINYADYSLEAYTQATEMKAKSLAFVDKTSGSYASQKQAADQIMLDLDKAYEFANGIQNNNEAAQMWALLRDPNKKFVGGLIAFWRDQQSSGLSKGFRTEYKQNISDVFDRLICLEANKREATTCPEIK